MLLAADFLNRNIFLYHLNKQVESQTRELEELDNNLAQLRGFTLDFAEGEKIFPCRSMPGLWISAEIAV
jgi:hypothetical protein